MKKFFVISVLILALAWGFASYSLQHRAYDTYNDCRKIWSSRGLYDQSTPRNSYQSVIQAFAAGAPGVEIDIHYDPEMDRFVLSHAHPKIGPDGKRHYTLKNGELQTLGELFKRTGKGHWFWLDFKNLDDLNDVQTQKAIARLRSIAPGSLWARIYVEGNNPLKLKRYQNAGLHTIFDTDPLPAGNPLSPLLLGAYKIAFAWGGFDAVGMNYGKADNPVYAPRTAKVLGNIPVFVYHIPDKPDILKTLLKDPQVRVMLVGRDVSLNRFNLTACKDQP